MDFVKKAIKEIKTEGEFSGDIGQFITTEQPKIDALKELRAAQAGEDEEVREGIFEVIADIGKAVDPLYEEGGGLIRDRTILIALIDDGLTKKGPARNFCLNTLKESVPPIFLNQFGDRLLVNLKAMPDPTLFLIIAKAKPKTAAETVDKFMENPAWQNSKEAQIASAALGNTKLETDFINRFLNETDPGEKATDARDLGYIGTENALKALASEMRTDLVIENPGVTVRSVRIFIIEALSYNFPDKQFLWDNAVEEDENYEKIEKFCEETFGTKWSKERPPFLWIQGFPSEPPPN